jgi:hypothetical protein
MVAALYARLFVGVDVAVERLPFGGEVIEA